MAVVLGAPNRRAVPVAHVATDTVLWAVMLPLALFLRYDLDPASFSWSVALEHVTVVLAAQIGVGVGLGLYRRRWRYGTFDEVVALTATVLLAGVVLVAWEAVADGGDLPRSVPFVATALTLLFAVGVRSVWRLYRARCMRPIGGEPVVVVGAGEGADQIVRSLLNDAESPYRPVALVDDDPLKSRLRLHGVRVEGSVDDLAHVAAAHGAHTALLAIPSGDPDLVRRVTDLAERSTLRLLVLPSPRQMFGNPTVADIRPIAEADLLGRDSVEIDSSAVAHYVTGRRVLVTGAGGSIGSELCRQLARFEPSALVMLDRDESGLHAVQLTIEGRALLDSPNIVLADIRDAVRVREVFEEQRPEVVFHAAALKHMPLLELHPDEAWKTNVIGTQNVLAAARAVGVERFVNISTDKAADPVNVLGYSKRLTERLTAVRHESSTGTYVSVRFGNVLGSRGSVLTSFRAQSDGGGPITVTHPEVTRFFMTIEEAVRLTLFAGAIGATGEVLVLDMGDPVRIVDVARRFADQHVPPLDIVFTGLRPGEKLHEVLIAHDEPVEARVHPLISHAPVPPLDFDALCAAAEVEGVTLQRLSEWSTASRPQVAL